MAQGRYGFGRLLSTVAVLALLAGAAIASGCLWYWGDWEAHAWGLTLALRILWGAWVVVLLATVLTRVTLFGWSFRNYLRLDERGPPLPRRATAAPWYKSGAASFSTTVVLVSLTGGIAVAVAVMWVLKDVTGDWVFRLVVTILGITWWVLVVATVLTRVALFGRQKYRHRPDQNSGGQT